MCEKRQSSHVVGPIKWRCWDEAAFTCVPTCGCQPLNGANEHTRGMQARWCLVTRDVSAVLCGRGYVEPLFRGLWWVVVKWLGFFFFLF